MFLAELNLNEQYWHVVTLIIALFQPLLVLLLVVGFVLASAHLLTMLGTRWGNRRVSPKALLFSLTVHLLLGCGLVALIPEYRARVITRLAEMDPEPIRIVTVPESVSSDLPRSREGATPIWNEIPQSQSTDWQRFHTQPLLTADSPLSKPNELLEIQPELARDSRDLPPESRPVPEQEIQAEPGELQEASIEMALETVAPQSRPDVELSATRQDRSPNPAVTLSQTRSDRPDSGSVDLLRPEVSPDRSHPQMTDLLSPEAPLSKAPDDEVLARRQGPVPIATQAEELGLEPSSEQQSTAHSGPTQPTLTRTQPRRSFAGEESTSPGRYRPEVTPTTPEPAVRRPESSISSRNESLPMPGERPQLVRQEDAFMARSDQSRIPSAYQLRSDELRERALLQYGGTEESEAAVDRSLKWLASIQRQQGNWDAEATGAGRVEKDEAGVDRQFAGRRSDTGLTALAVLAFLGKLHTVDQGEYSPVVNRALRWLVAQQKPIRWPGSRGRSDGYLGGDASPYAAMYCHGMATFALAEAYAMSRDNPDAQWLREPLEKAVSLILDAQLEDGGWRYVKGQPDGDMSMFGWQLMALKSAEAAGVRIPDEAKTRMRTFLHQRRRGTSGGLAGYRADDRPSAPMTAEALFSRQMLGMDTNPSATHEAAKHLLAHRPRRTELNYYYWYYGTLAMHQHGGPEWDEWNTAMRDLVIAEQRQTGPYAGSWDPRDVWGGYGGRVYSTALATLSLEVYYRYLPLYRLNESTEHGQK